MAEPEIVMTYKTTFKGFLRFCRWNLRHLVWTLPGFRLRLDPDYPLETNFLPDLISDSVLEYRFYWLVAFWALFIASWLPEVAYPVIGFLWGYQATGRAKLFRTAFSFWRQAYRESPGKIRTKTRYCEELMIEIEQRMKTGLPTAWLEDEARRLMDIITKP
jgi:hypothetical protein